MTAKIPKKKLGEKSDSQQVFNFVHGLFSILQNTFSDNDLEIHEYF